MDNPFIYGGPVTPADFFGRQDSIHFMMDRLYGRSRSSIALWGDRRVGKSSLLYYLTQEKLRQEWQINPAKNHMVFIDCQLLTEFSRPLFWELVLEHMAELEAEAEAPTLAEMYLDKGDFADRKMQRLFRRLQKHGETVTILLDEFSHLMADQEATGELQALLSLLRVMITAVNPTSPHPRPLSLVTSTRRPLDEICRPIYGQADIGSPFHNPFVFERIKPFELPDVHQLLTTKLGRTSMEFAAHEIDHIIRIAGRHPILVQSYAGELFAAKKEGQADLTHIDQEFVMRNRAHFHDFWLYSSQQEQAYLRDLLNGVPLDYLSPSQENASRQLIDRGLLLSKGELFSPVFEDWLRLNIDRLQTNANQSTSRGLDAVALHGALGRYFNVAEVKDLCFKLQITTYERLAGASFVDKSRELVLLVERNGRLLDLQRLMAEQRPLIRELQL